MLHTYLKSFLSSRHELKSEKKLRAQKVIHAHTKFLWLGLCCLVSILGYATSSIYNKQWFDSASPYVSNGNFHSLGRQTQKKQRKHIVHAPLDNHFLLSTSNVIAASALSLVTPAYNCQTGAITFRSKGGDGSPIEYMAIGIKSWSTDSTGVIEAEKRGDPNSGTVVQLMARQGTVVVSYDFDFKAFCSNTGTGGALSLVTPAYNCQTGAITFRSKGGDGSPIEYMAIGIKSWSTDSTGVIEAEKRGDPNSGTVVQLMARQGTVVVSYDFDFKAFCSNTGTGGALSLVTPAYNCQTGAITFRSKGGDGSPIEYMAIGIKSWSTDSTGVIEAEKRGDPNSGTVVQLMARQGTVVVSYDFDFKAFCSNPVNFPPIAPVINNLVGIAGEPFSSQLPQFNDPENQLLVYTLTGTLPEGISFDKKTLLLSGVTSQTGNYGLVLKATDPAGLSASASFNLIINSKTTSTALQLTDPVYDCTTSKLTLNYTGGDGSQVEFSVEGLTDFSLIPTLYADISSPEGEDLVIKARQSGVIVSKQFKVIGCPYDSPGSISLQGLDVTKFNPRNASVLLRISNASFSTSSDDFSIQLNGTLISPSNLVITASAIALSLSLNDGLNNLSFYMRDSNGLILEEHYQIWAGSTSLKVSVVEKNNTLVPGAQVKIRLSDNKDVTAEGVASNGTITFTNLPIRTIIATALTTTNMFGSAGAVADGTPLVIRLLAFESPSSINNNDISLGTQGWNTGNSPVKVIIHQPETSSQTTNAPAVNQDLQLSTSGIGPQSMSRTFIPMAGAKSVTIRYRFITSEVPGGYFGSQYNDYYSISIRGKNGSSIVSEQNSMNGLGLSAFNYATGATAWKEVTLPLTVDNDIIQVDVLVANVEDGLYDSQVEVDFIDVKRLSILNPAFYDPDKVNSLTYLSIDQHAILNGKVPIYGTIKLVGPKDDKLTSLNLEVLQGDNVLSKTELAESARTKLFEVFGDDEKVEITVKELLFEIGSTAPLSADGNVQLRLNAKTEKGQEATINYGTDLPNLRLYKGTNRFSGRDENELDRGDGWGLPSIIEYAGKLPYLINDISNMNGNLFKPHNTHGEGVAIDLRYEGYYDKNNPKKTEVHAKALTDFLNTPLGQQVEVMYVTFERVPTDKFWTAIQSTTITSGGKKVKASEIIRLANGHLDHFHIRVRPTSTAQQAVAYNRVPRRNGGRLGISGEASLVVSPNPFVIDNQPLSIRLLTPQTKNVQADIIDISGRFMKTVSADSMAAETVLEWDGTDLKGDAVAPGIYLIRVSTSGKLIETRRVIVLK